MLIGLADNIPFPDVKKATPEGLVAVGGNLSPKRLLSAYRQGIFPWYSENQPIFWWSLDPRGIIPLDDFHVGATLIKVLKRKIFEIKINTAFEDVMRACAVRSDGSESGWITEEMISAYTELHRLGNAHSIESWRNGKLVGGVYGIAIGGLFAAESMFYLESNASKIALTALVERMKETGFTLFDCQMVTNVTKRMGAIEISREEYLKQLNKALLQNCIFI
ncbi:MAG TPA: leucyl/phenylalanyl-tRNA--protein transferase [Nitrospinota bacterium]|jgi:leucyl/phenylalanyl-tRNA--protein transferase|nr:leucyl/phenylalanyl-tRNA--protein transferase [Nitrospinota bacterium]HJN02062.1 leucyl/phenylalanyl-tRNA--protein transferase [Nitrospinota bacterium]|tara:strand:- start:271 stop:933 length:663 start_codon:yes stop_codon:yes gene_type:complete